MIPLFKVKMHPSAADRVRDVLDSGYIGQGSIVDQFEAEFSKLAPYPIVSTNSCTSAIHAVLMHLEVGPGDEVVTTPLTCTATNAPILAMGARPIWADVNDYGNIDPEDVARKITPRTKAIIAVNWTGRPADYLALKTLGIPVIEDAAHGPIIGKRETGDFICYSFGPIKHMTTGDGGAVATPDLIARERLRLIRWYGLDRTSSRDFRCEQDIKFRGLKFHMNDINAAIGLANLPHLYDTVSAHQANAAALWFGMYRHWSKWVAPFGLHSESNYWVFPVRVSASGRDKLQIHLTERGIASSRVHARNDKHPVFSFPNGPLPGLDQYDKTHLNIPCGWWLKPGDIETILTALEKFKH